MEPTKRADNISLKGGKMLLNRFCIDEDAAFELSEVNYLKTFYDKTFLKTSYETENRESKGKEYVVLHLPIWFINDITVL